MMKKVKTEVWDSLDKKESPLKGPEGGNANPDDPAGGMMEMMKNMYQNGDE
jgi:hypothetical protein